MDRTWAAWREVPTAAADLLLGAQCWGCGQPGRTVCHGCRDRLAGLDVFPAQPVPRPPGFPRTMSGGVYEGVVADLLRAHKEHQARGTRAVLAERLAAATLAVLEGRGGPDAGAVVLVPIPSARATVRARGEDVVRGLARSASAALRRDGWSVRMAPWLMVGRPVRDQAGLSSAERAANLAGAFAARAARPGEVSLLVDDVTTTGQTLAEGARALREAGCRVLGAATVAATVRRGSDGWK